MRKIFFIFLIVLAGLISVPLVSAHCPLCTGAIGAGAVAAKYLGIDVSIIGLFVGAFGISTGLWFNKWLNGKLKKKYFKFQDHAIVFGSFLLTVIPLKGAVSDNIYLPLFWFGELGSLFNRIYWINKLIIGSVIGMAVTLLAFHIHNTVKRAHGKVLFPFQGIAFTLIMLIISGATMYFVFG